MNFTEHTLGQRSRMHGIVENWRVVEGIHYSQTSIGGIDTAYGTGEWIRAVFD